MADPFERYSRQMILPGWGREGQGRLAKKTAAVVGCGALGSHIASHLVRAGVGRLVLADRDCVEWHNLPRQALFAERIEARPMREEVDVGDGHVGHSSCHHHPSFGPGHCV